MINYLIPLQYAITPVVFISANSLILLSLTNRFSYLSNKIRTTTIDRLFLFKRLKLLRNAILLDIISILILLLMIVLIFIFSVFYCKYNEIIIILFILSCLSIIGSIIMFLIDVLYSTHLLHLFIKNNESSNTLNFASQN